MTFLLFELFPRYQRRLKLLSNITFPVKRRGIKEGIDREGGGGGGGGGGDIDYLY